MKTDCSAIPCHIIAGPLGVGKTSAIVHYLRENADGQRVGVLVNDFGPVGLDSTTLKAEAPETQVLNVPGGCICCTMLSELPGSIRRLISSKRLDRLIIEPSGMASPDQVVQVLKQVEDELSIRLQPTIVMLSVSDFDEHAFEHMAYYKTFCEVADILVLNRIDKASTSKIEHAIKWASHLDPPKLRVVSTSYGRLPRDVFELACMNTDKQQRSDHVHAAHHQSHLHDHDQSIYPGGVVIDQERRFEQAVLLANLKRICSEGIEQSQVLRLKGVFRTNDGWLAVEIADNDLSYRPSAHRGDHRLEWLARPAAIDPPRMLEEIGSPVNQ